MVVIIDYETGNLESIKNILKSLNIKSKISRNISDISNAEILILPGVGTFDFGMKNLIKYNLVDILNDEVKIKNKPIIGICLGMQLMFQSSEEGKELGLNWIQDKVIKLKSDKSHKIPHMGWSNVNSNVEYFQNDLHEKRFYFVHSYYIESNCKYSTSIANYGNNKISSSIQKNNIYGFQFHPEKSNKYGKSLLKNLFSKIYERI